MQSGHTNLNTDSVSIEDLKDLMHIVEYNGFSSKYNPMNAETCEWVKLNFKGVHSVVKRADKKLALLANDVQEGDILIKLNKFPEKLTKFTQVNEKLIHDFERYGFHKFLVLKSLKKITPKQEKQKKDFEKANLLFSKLKEGIQLRDEASIAVENLFDNTRKGKLNAKEVKHYTQKIISSETTDAISAIVSLKESDQTYAHCIEVGTIFYSTYSERIKRKNIPSVFKSKSEILLAAFLHDIGKSGIPKDVLDSTIRYKPDSKEMKSIRNHPRISAKLLYKMGLPDYIINMAHYHHVKYQPGMQTSYPTEINYDQVNPETRLLSIVDLYQALIGKRRYKKSWIPPEAMRYLETLGDIEFDGETWDDFFDIIGVYPVGSLLKLSDKSTAFVIGVSESNPERPQVAVVKDQNGRELDRNPFLDLENIPELSIAEELDPNEIFGDETLGVFENINLVN